MMKNTGKLATRPWFRWAVVATFAAFAAVFMLQQRPANEAGKTDPVVERPPNILVYMVDTLRASELGTYGADITKTPAIDRFAADAELFEHATAPAPATRATIASFITGVAPAVHGVKTGLHALSEPTAPLARLPELLQAQGYYTAALVANPNVDPVFGFARGFDTYAGLYRKPDRARVPSSHDLTYTAPMMTAEIKQFIETAPADRPFFLFVLTIDPHGPYTPPAPYDGMYDSRATGGEAGSMKNLIRMDEQLAAGEQVATDLVLALYRGEISYADRAFGELMSWMRERDMLDETLVVLSADHGEAFAEHGNRGHGKTIYQETLHIPLIVRYPSWFSAGRRRAEKVSLLDLSTTIAIAAGATPPGYWTGRDLRGDNLSGPVFSMSHQPGYALTSITRGAHKLIQNELDDSLELYDLDADPLERSPLAGTRHENTVRLMAAELASFRERSEALRSKVVRGDTLLDDDEIPDAIREQLESLGYVDR
jgi:arylsulfatase A-like enzyme